MVERGPVGVDEVMVGVADRDRLGERVEDLGQPGSRRADVVGELSEGLGASREVVHPDVKHPFPSRWTAPTRELAASRRQLTLDRNRPGLARLQRGVHDQRREHPPEALTHPTPGARYRRKSEPGHLLDVDPQRLGCAAVEIQMRPAESSIANPFCEISTISTGYGSHACCVVIDLPVPDALAVRDVDASGRRSAPARSRCQVGCIRTCRASPRSAVR